MKLPIVVNLFGAPGAGKSTGAAYIFSQLKLKGINAELVTEFAKDKVWEENPEVFKNQAYIFGKQSFRLSRCRDKVDVIITDSPLVLSILYNAENGEETKFSQHFDKFVLEVFNSYNNLNYLILRNKPYNPIGRHQTEKESDALVNKLVRLLKTSNIEYSTKFGDLTGYDIIIKDVIAKIRG